MAREVNPDNRNEFVSDKYEIEAWVGFDFPGRGQTHSKLKWHWYHFSGVDFNARNNKTAIYKIIGEKGDEGWSAVPDVDGEKGNLSGPPAHQKDAQRLSG
jgi:alpha-amylase